MNDIQFFSGHLQTQKRATPLSVFTQRPYFSIYQHQTSACHITLSAWPVQWWLLLLVPSIISVPEGSKMLTQKLPIRAFWANWRKKQEVWKRRFLVGKNLLYLKKKQKAEIWTMVIYKWKILGKTPRWRP